YLFDINGTHTYPAGIATTDLATVTLSTPDGRSIPSGYYTYVVVDAPAPETPPSPTPTAPVVALPKHGIVPVNIPPTHAQSPLTGKHGLLAQASGDQKKLYRLGASKNDYNPGAEANPSSTPAHYYHSAYDNLDNRTTHKDTRHALRTGLNAAKPTSGPKLSGQNRASLEAVEWQKWATAIRNGKLTSVDTTLKGEVVPKAGPLSVTLDYKVYRDPSKLVVTGSHSNNSNPLGPKFAAEAKRLLEQAGGLPAWPQNSQLEVTEVRQVTFRANMDTREQYAAPPKEPPHLIIH